MNIREPILALLTLVAPLSLAAQVQTVQPGAWSAGSTWQGGLVPGNGERVTILHPITVDVPVTIGTSPGAGGAAAIAVQPSGAVTILDNTRLSVRGDIILADAVLTLGQGSVLEFDASQAVSPSSSRYLLRIGTAGDQNARLVLNGDRNNRCAIRSVTANGAAHAAITDGGFRGGGLVTGTYCDFTRLGDESTPALSTAPTADSLFSLTGAIFDGGGRLFTNFNVGSGATFVLKDSTFRNTRSADAAHLAFYDDQTGGERRLEGNVFDRIVLLYPPRDLIITGNIFNNALGTSPDDANEGWALFSGNFIRNTTTREVLLSGSTTDNYWLTDLEVPAVDYNPHFVQALTFGDMSIDGDIFEYTGTDDNGDAIGLANPPIPATLAVRNSIVLPNRSGGTSGTLASLLGGPNAFAVIEHNTYIAGIQGVAVSETYPGHVGMVQSFRSNIAWDTTPRGFKMYDSGPNDVVVNLMSSSAANYNTGFRLFEEYLGLEFSSGLPGLNDVDVDPQFFDRERDLARWDLVLGGPGTVAHAVQELRRRNDPTSYNPAYTVQSLRDFIRTGFAPTNPLLLNAGHDGVTIGAVPHFTLLTPTPTATPVPTLPPGVTPTPTPTATPGVSPTAVPTPPPGPGLPDSPLPKPKVKVKKRTVTVTMPDYTGLTYRVTVKNGTTVLRRRTKRFIAVFRNVPPGSYQASYTVRRSGITGSSASSSRKFRVRR